MTTKPATKKTAVKKPAPKKDQPVADVSVSVEPPKPITAALGSELYTVRPLKGSLGIAMGARLQGVGKDAAKLKEGVYHVVSVIFGPSDSEKIFARLEDPEDALDYSHVMELMNALMERSTGNPTT